MRHDPMRTRPTAQNFACLAAISLMLVGSAAANEPYRLSISDKLTVKVVEWNAGEASFTELTALGGEYVIGADGDASFPFVGATPSAGKSATELAATLGTELQQALGLTTAPNVTIEIAAYGPVYVSGDVNTPGQYPYAPGLTVIKALTLAGGERRAADANSRPEKELLTNSGALDLLKDEHVRQQVRLARLDAELAGAQTVTVPPELANVDGVQALVGAEQAIMLARQRQDSAQTTSLDEEVALLNRETDTLEQKRVAMQHQLEQARDQLTKINQLSDDGLALASRVTALETSVADLESRLLDLDTANLQAKKDIGSAERERAELSDARISDVSLERQTVDGEIAALALKITNQEALLQEAAINSGVPANTGNSLPTYRYSIVRGSEEIAADMNTNVQAGDVIVARLALPDEAEAAHSN